jgi:hypothetical protein
VGLLLCLTLPTSAHATTIAYYTDEELFDRADLVLMGIVWSRDVHREGPPFTGYEIETIECFKGCAPKQFITMHMPGVPRDELTATDEWYMGMPSPKVGSRVIVYLKYTEDKIWLAPISLGLGHYTLYYSAGQKRFIAHRDVDDVAILKPATPGREGEEAVVPRDRIATEVVSEIRKLAAKRSRR